MHVNVSVFSQNNCISDCDENDRLDQPTDVTVPKTPTCIYMYAILTNDDTTPRHSYANVHMDGARLWNLKLREKTCQSVCLEINDELKMLEMQIVNNE